MDSSDLRLVIGLLFGTFLAIVLLSDMVKRRARAPRMKVKVKPSGFRRTMTPETPPDGGFRAAHAEPEGPRSPRHDWKVPRN